MSFNSYDGVLARHLHNYSHKEINALADRVGVSRQTIRLWVRGDVRPHPMAARLMAQELGSTVEELFPQGTGKAKRVTS